MSRLLDQLDVYLNLRKSRLRHRERREINRQMWRTNRRTLGSVLDNPRPGKFFWRVIDYEALPIERLKPYLDPRAIEAAIAVAISMGLRDLGGVQIEQDIGGCDGPTTTGRGSATAARREAARQEADYDRGRTPFHVAYDRRADHGRFTRS